MKILVSKLGNDSRMSLQPESEAEHHQLNEIYRQIEETGFQPVMWAELENIDKWGITVTITKP